MDLAELPYKPLRGLGAIWQVAKVAGDLNLYVATEQHPEHPWFVFGYSLVLKYGEKPVFQSKDALSAQVYLTEIWEKWVEPHSE